MMVDLIDPGLEFSTTVQLPGSSVLDTVRHQALMARMLNQGVKPFEHPMNIWFRQAEITNLEQASATCHTGMAEAAWARQGTRLRKPCALSGRILNRVIATFRSTLAGDIIPEQEETVQALEECEDQVDEQVLSDARALLQSRQDQLALYQQWPIRLYDRGICRNRHHSVPIESHTLFHPTHLSQTSLKIRAYPARSEAPQSLL